LPGVVRLAQEADAARVHAIYAPLVRETAISFELEPPTVEEIGRRIRTTLEELPWLVYEQNGEVAGYAYAGRFRARPAYVWTVEVTLYVDALYRRRGVGSALYRTLFECLRLLGYRTAVAGIAYPNPASVRLHERLGFTPVGVFHNVGNKLGRWHDVGWWELTLRELPNQPTPPRPLPSCVNSAEWSEALAPGFTSLNP